MRRLCSGLILCAASTKIQQKVASFSGKQLSCTGRACFKCGNCRDWYYTGDSDSWNWIRNYKNWNKQDRKRWENEQVWTRFKRRVDSTCNSLHGYWDCRSDWDLDGSRHSITGYLAGVIEDALGGSGWSTGDWIRSSERYTGGGYACLCEDNRET